MTSDPLGHASYFTVLARWPDEIRLFTIEGPLIESAEEALDAVRQHDRAVLVLRSDPDCARRDVSEDIARLWLQDLIARGFDCDSDRLPGFIAAHLDAHAIAQLL